MRAKDIMTAKVVTVLEDTPIEEVVATLLKWRVSAVPVIDTKNRLVGMVSEGDLLHRADDGGRESWLSGLLEPDQWAQRFAKSRGKLAKDVMSSPAISVADDETLTAVATVLEENGIKRVPVLHKGKLVGIVSRANLLHGLAAAPEPGSDADVSTRTSAPDDQTIRATILNALHNDIRARGAINVIVFHSAVDLWGGVETEAERRAVRVAAENTPGVTSVRDHLYVMPQAIRHLLHADESG